MKKIPGSDFATGRPATGRIYTISVRISKEAHDLFSNVKNKSEFIDNLIKRELGNKDK